MGRKPAARAPAHAGGVVDGVSRLGACRPPPQARGNERAIARNGNNAKFRSGQPPPPDLCRTEAHRHRAFVWAALGRELIKNNGCDKAAIVSIVRKSMNRRKII